MSCFHNVSSLHSHVSLTLSLASHSLIRNFLMVEKGLLWRMYSRNDFSSLSSFAFSSSKAQRVALNNRLEDFFEGKDFKETGKKAGGRNENVGERAAMLYRSVL